MTLSWPPGGSFEELSWRPRKKDEDRAITFPAILRWTIVNTLVGPTVHTKNYIFSYFCEQSLVLFTMVPRNRGITVRFRDQKSARRAVQKSLDSCSLFEAIF